MLDYVNSRLSILQRIGLIGGVMLLPIGVLAHLFWEQSNKDIHFAQEEMDGVTYLENVWPALASAVLEHPVATEGIVQSAAEFDARFDSTEQSSAALAAIQSGDEPLQVETLTALIARVGDNSNLVLDPDLDSYYVMDAVVAKIPELMRLTAAFDDQIKSIGARALSLDERTQLLIALSQLRAQQGFVDSAFNSAFDASADGSVSAELAQARDNLDVAIEAQQAAVLRYVENPAAPGAAARVDAANDATVAAADIAWRASAQTLRRLLEIRVDGFSSRLAGNLALAGFLIALAGALALLLARGLAGRINRLVDTLQKLQSGDLETEVPFLHDRAESGRIAAAVRDFKETLRANRELEETTRLARERQAEEEKAARERALDAEREQRAREAAAEQERQDAKRREETLAQEARQHAETERQAALLKTADAFDATITEAIETLSSAVAMLNSNAAFVADTVDSSSSSADHAESSASESAQDVGAVASAAEQLSASIAEISQRVMQSADAARDGENRAALTSAKIAELSEATKRIGNITNLISGLAGQTNLLALNATIEAARAGEAGRGFSIVATEVKSLADQSRRATLEIEAIIQEITAATDHAVDTMSGVSGAIEKMSEFSAAIASAMSEQTSAVHEISSRAAEVANKSAAAAQAATMVKSASMGAADAVRKSQDAAEALTQQTDSLKGAAKSFLERIRAA